MITHSFLFFPGLRPVTGIAILSLSILLSSHAHAGAEVLTGEFRLQPGESLTQAPFRIATCRRDCEARLDAYRGVNPRHGLGVDFTPQGLRLHGDGWVLEMALARMGYENALHPVATGERIVRDNRLEYRRDGLVEWYINDENGLEQGFTLVAPPAIGKPGRLLLELEVGGDLQPRPDSSGTALGFSRPDGTGLLRYGGLRAWDARGRELPSAMQLYAPTVAGGRYRIVLAVDERAAVYPITIDPLMTSQSVKIVGWDSVAEDEFGAAVSLSGSVAVVGAPGDNDVGANSGSVYVFERNRKGANIWGDTGKIVANDAAAGAEFGAAVAISGDTLVVGAPLAADAGAEAGAAYVFVRSQKDPVSWIQVANLRVENIAIGGRLGSAVAISGDTVVVGAPLAGGGEVYIFERNQGGADAWGQVALLRARGIDRFGSALAISGDTVAVGAPLANDGVVYVFERNQGGANHWGVMATVRATAGKGGDRFGEAVALDKNILVVGAPDSDVVAVDAGVAYVFYRNRGGTDRWGQVAALGVAELGADDRLGSAVSVSGDAIVVGARFDDTFGVNAGAAYIFERNQGGADRWVAVTKLGGDDIRSGDLFGEALVLDGNTLLVGVPADSDVGVNSGAAYAFLRSGNAWIQRAKLTADDAASNDLFGQAVAISGDTVAVGAYQDDDRGGDSGSVYVLRRNRKGADRWGVEAKITADDGAPGDQFGQVLALDDDVLVVGAAFDDVAGADSGSAYVFYRNRGGSDNWGLVAKLTADDASAGDFFGSAVAVSGDRVLVGAFAGDDAGSASGAAYLFERNRGGADNWGQVAKLTATDAEATDQFGFAVALSGDTAVVGAHFEASAGNYGGAAYVFERNQGGADAWGQTAKLGANDGRANDQFGFAVAIVGETILIGAPGKDDAGANTGAAYVFVPNRGAAVSWMQAAKLSPADAEAGDRFGESVAISGDTALVGARRNRDAGEETGSAYVFGRNQNGTDNWGQLIKLIATGIAGGDQFGVSVRIDGNFAVVGAPFEDGVASATGAAYIFQLQF